MRLGTLLLVVFLNGVGPGYALAQPQPPKDFVPVDEAPAGEQIPAMPLLGSAYAFIWLGVLGYVWSLGRKLQQVEKELGELESRRR